MLLNFNDNALPFLIAFLNGIVGLFGNFLSFLEIAQLLKKKRHFVWL